MSRQASDELIVLLLMFIADFRLQVDVAGLWMQSDGVLAALESDAAVR